MTWTESIINLEVTPTKEQVDYIKTFLRKGGDLTGNKVRSGNINEQIDGQMGGLVVQDQFDCIRGTRTDGGTLVLHGKKIWVKTKIRGRNDKNDTQSNMKEEWAHNLFLEQAAQFEFDILLFLNYNKRRNVIQVCGWLTKDEFLKRAILIKAGERFPNTWPPLYNRKGHTLQILQSNINKIDSWDKFEDIMRKL